MLYDLLFVLFVPVCCVSVCVFASSLFVRDFFVILYELACDDCCVCVCCWFGC